jgi:DNA-binding response OmpR family regulator
MTRQRVCPRVLLTGTASAALDAVRDLLRGCSVGACGSTGKLERQVGAMSPHLVVAAEGRLLDLLGICRTVRQATQAPLLVLGQRENEEDEVRCIEYGADAYLGPGSPPSRVQAHVPRLLQRVPNVAHSAASTITYGDIRIDLRRHRVFRGDKALDSTQKEFAVLRLLVENAGRTLSRRDFLEEVSGSAGAPESRIVDVYIQWLREKLEDDIANPRRIGTIRGIGCCFEA